MTQQTLPDLLRNQLRQRGIKQRELAEKLGKDGTTISAWIRGKQLPRPDDNDTITRLADVLGVEKEEIRRLLSGRDQSHVSPRSVRSAEALKVALDETPGFLDRVLPTNSWRSIRSIRQALQELGLEASEGTVACYLKTTWANGEERLWIEETGLARHLCVPQASIPTPAGEDQHDLLDWFGRQFRDQEWARQAVRIACRRLNLLFGAEPTRILSRDHVVDEIIIGARASFPAEITSVESFRPFAEAMLQGFQELHMIEAAPAGIMQRWQLSASMIVNRFFGVDLGVPQLRFLFDGGLLARVQGGVIASIYGAPGTCKTTLAVQIAAAFASAGQISLYMTADETMESFMDRLSFLGYQPRLMASDYAEFSVSRQKETLRIYPLDPWDSLLPEHLPKEWPGTCSDSSIGHLLLAQIPNRRDFLADRGPLIRNLNWLLSRLDPRQNKLCGTFLDSVDAVLAGGDRQAYEDLFRFSRRPRTIGFFISETSNPDSMKLRSHMADIVIKMGFRTRVGSFKERVIEIEKCRSQSHIRGEHMLAVHHSDGFAVYPSIQSLLSVWRRRVRTLDPPRSISWKIPDIDLAFHLGLDLQRGEPVLLCGPRSTLKLPLALAFLLSERLEEDPGRTLLLSLRDDEASILRSIRRFPQLNALLTEGFFGDMFTVAHFPPDYMTGERFIHWVQRRLKHAKERGTPVARVVFSNLGQLDSNSPAIGKEPLFVPALIELFRRKHISSLFLSDGSSKPSREWFGTVVSTSRDSERAVRLRVVANAGSTGGRQANLVFAEEDGAMTIMAVSDERKSSAPVSV